MSVVCFFSFAMEGEQLIKVFDLKAVNVFILKVHFYMPSSNRFLRIEVTVFVTPSLKLIF